MQPDRVHGHVRRHASKQSHVASLKEWCMNISGECRPGAEKIDSILVKQECFRNCKAYLAQIYRVNPKDINGKRYRVLDFRWANFGWGKDTKGMMINHPHEVWLYTCNGENNMEEWHLEEPVKVIRAKFSFEANLDALATE